MRSTRNPFIARDGMTPGTDQAPTPPTTGLSGAMLDDMLTRRWREGFARGHQIGHDAAEANYAAIFEQGHEAGAAAAYEKATGDLSGLLLTASRLAALHALPEADGRKARVAIGQALDVALDWLLAGPDADHGKVRGTPAVEEGDPATLAMLLGHVQQLAGS